MLVAPEISGVLASIVRRMDSSESCVRNNRSLAIRASRRCSGSISGEPCLKASKLAGEDRHSRRLRIAFGHVRLDHATLARPFFSTSVSNLSDAPDGRFSPRSHLLTKLVVTFR